MSLLKPALLSFVSIIPILNALSQDKLYFTSNTNQGNVQNITQSTVTFTPLQNTKSVNVETKKVLLVFNKQGSFLVPSHMDFSGDLSSKLIQAFLSRKSTNTGTDQIYVSEKKILEGIFVSEDKNFVYYTINSKPSRIDKAKVVAIIFKDGHHLIYRTPSEAAETLWSIQQNSMPGYASGNTIKKEISTTQENPVGGKDSSGQIETSAARQPVAGTKDTLKKDSLKPLTFEQVAPNISKEEFAKKATEKTTLFTDYLKILCNKQAQDFELDKATEQAIKLFVSENARVETASATRQQITSKLIRTYLEDVRMLRYDKIIMEWTKVQYVSEIKLGFDGNYHGIVSFEQVFKGYRDGKLIYEDITTKDAQVVLKTYEKIVEGNSKVLWEVLLSDIGVTSYE